MLGLLADARLVLTDSGGIQEETTALAVPCLTMRENTERPITVEQGTNTLVGPRSRRGSLACVDEILASGGKRGRVPELWDGHAADAHRRAPAGVARPRARPSRSAAHEQRTPQLRRRAGRSRPRRDRQRADDRRRGLFPGLGVRAAHRPQRLGHACECRVERNIDRILQLLADADARATFFTLGWIAERYPATDAHGSSTRGHELASHGYEHHRATEQDRDEFLADIRLAKAILEDIAGARCAATARRAFRSASRIPGPSTHRARPATATARASIRSATTTTACPTRRASRIECGRSCSRSRSRRSACSDRNWPAGGGGYFRLLPYAVSRWSIRRINARRRPAGDVLFPSVGARSRAAARAGARGEDPLSPLPEPAPDGAAPARLLRDFRWDRVDRVFLDAARVMEATAEADGRHCARDADRAIASGAFDCR